MSKLTVATCSYAPDFERCSRLCKSIDAFCSASIDHLLVVPRRDLPMFRALSTSRRDIVCVEDVVPTAFRQLPLSNRWWLMNDYRPVRGWIMQQITKLSVSRATDASFLLFADSDIQFIDALSPEDVVHGAALRLYSEPGKMNTGQHLQWHEIASDLLGIERKYAGFNYNGQLISWRRSDLQALHEHLENKHQRAWAEVIGRCTTVSEYILFGNFVERVQSNIDTDYYRTDRSLVYSCWNAEQLSAFNDKQAVLPQDIKAIHLQSNLGLSNLEEQQLISAAISRRQHDHS